MAFFRPSFTAGILLSTLAVVAPVRAETVTGKIVGPDGKPVVNAKVFVTVFSATAAVPTQETKTLTSDASGAFSIEVPKPPDVKEKNPTVARAVVAAPGFGFAQAPLTLTPGDNTIRLEKGAAVRGKVVDAAGKPVAGADVRLRSVYMGGPRGSGASYLWLSDEIQKLPGLTAKTDVNGAWLLDNLPASAVHADIVLADTKYVQTSFEILLNGPAGKPIVARPGAGLLGKVVAKDGKPRSGIRIFARLENFRDGFANAITAADGTYQLRGLPTGAVAVWIGLSNASAGKAADEVAAPLRQVVVTEGKEATAPDLVMSPGGVVDGTVTDALDEKPVPDTQISVPDAMGVFNAVSSREASSKGRFSLRLPPGKYKLSIPWEPKGYLTTTESGENSAVEVNITEGATVPVAFRLARALTLSGVAQDASGKPVPGVEITVMEQGNPSKATTDPSGKWTLSDVKPGKVRIVAANDYEVVSGNEITLSAKETPAPAVLTVKQFKPSLVSGRVITRGGTPVSSVIIQSVTKMRMGNGSYWFDFGESRTDNQGLFTLPPVRPENSEVQLRFNKPGYKASSGGTLTRDGDRFVIADAVMTALDTGRTIKGRVTDSRGKPVSGAIVAATRVAIGPGETRTDALGRFTLAGVPEDSRLLAARGPLFGSITVTRNTASVTVPLKAARKVEGSAAEDHARAIALVREVKKRYLNAKRRNEKVSDFAVSELPLFVAPLDFPLALELAKPAGTNPIDDQTLAQMIREVAQHNPACLNDWAIPALKDIGITAVRASAAYAIVIGLPEGPSKKALARQVYEDMKLLTLDGSEHWVVRRVTQMAVLAGMLGLPEESKSWADKAILGATKDKENQYISVVTYESVNGGLPLVRYVLAKVNSKEKALLFWQVLPGLTRINARAAQKLLGEMEADPELSPALAKDDYYRSQGLLELVRALAPQDPAAALRIAEQLQGTNYSFSSAALALSAQGQPDTAKAALLYERAASLRDAAGSPEVLAKIASLAFKSDPALGKKLFDWAEQLVREQERSGMPNASSSAEKALLARELTNLRPGESRLMLTVAAGYLLTPEGQKEDTTATYRQNLAMAWLPFSVDQALSIAEKLPEKQETSGYEIRNRTLQKIVVWLLTDPAKRNKLLLSDYDQYGFNPRNY